MTELRVLVTGGAGYLGSRVVDALKGRGCRSPFVPRSRDYDLRRSEDIERVLRDARPDMVIHLAARVGGIGANRSHPAEFFYDNLLMGTQLLHESWRARVSKFVRGSTVCAYPELTPGPIVEGDLSKGHSQGTDAPYRLATKMLLVQ